MGKVDRVEPERLREMLEYDPATGTLTWKRRPVHHFSDEPHARAWNTKFAGKQAKGTPAPAGHLVINIGGVPRLFHHLAWAIVHGEYPQEIDHKNRNPADNRLDNLRECTRSENQHNQGVRKNNRSGFKGVSWVARLNKWRACIVVNWKQQHLGMFDTAEAAHAAYCEAAKRLHGEFANYGASICAAT